MLSVSPTMSAADFVRTDTAEDAVSSFELASVFLCSAKSDERYWKWFVIACHAGVQGAFALVLERGEGLLVQKPGVMQRTLEAAASGAFPPQPHMDNFLRLYQKVQLRANFRSLDVQPIIASPERDSALSSLDQLRDEFLHFNVKSWSIEVALIRRATGECVSMVQFLINQPSSVVWHEVSHEHRIKSALALLHGQLS